MFEQIAPHFLEQRLSSFRDRSQQAVNSSGSIDEFILDKTDISPTKDGRAYRMDDESIYSQTLPTMRNLYGKLIEKGASKESTFFSAAIYTAQIEQTRYFNGLPTSDRAEARSKILAHTTGEFGPVSIADLREAPMCSERAAVAHNVLHLVGVSSTFHSGVVGQPTGRGFELAYQNGHAFLTVKSADGNISIFDPANPIKYKSKGITLREVPSVYPIKYDGTQPELAELPTYEKTADGSFVVQKRRKLVYGFS